jgi:hypothetical protein
MNLFWARAENVTPALRFESSHRFKILRLRKMATAWVGDRQVVFGGSRDESISLRETRHDVSLSTFAAPTALETSAGLRIGADVQIGGGVRVGDAFQVISGVKSIAIWVTEFCVEISQAGHASRSLRTRETNAGLPNIPKAKRANGVGVKRAERTA